MSSARAVLAGLPAIAEDLADTYRDLHRHPEVSGQETRTNALITERLDALGLQTVQVGGGVVGVLRNGEGPTVAFRADTDALPVTEDTGLPYSSQVDGVMHACGHDMHVACALGAATLLAGHRDAWSGTYVAVFQPAEETASGARAMVDAGIADAMPRPDVYLGQHVMPGPAGTVSVGAGPALATGDSLRITVFGTGSHGSMPHLGVDPVVLAAAIILRLQQVVSRELAPDEFGVVTVGALHAGTKSNVIGDRAELLVNVRSYDDAVRARILAAVERIVRGECAASGSPAEPTFELYDQYPLTDNDAATSERVRAAVVDALGGGRVGPLVPLTGSEDFSVVPDALGVPYTFWTFGGFAEGTTPVGNHNPGFAPVIEPTLSTGTSAAVAAALAWLGRDR